MKFPTCEIRDIRSKREETTRFLNRYSRCLAWAPSAVIFLNVFLRASIASGATATPAGGDLSEIRAVELAPASCTAPPSGMIAWWPGDGNADDLQGNYPGTLVNGTTFAAGEVALSFSFDGTDDYVDVGDLDLAAAFTLDLWLNPTQVSGTRWLLVKQDAGGFAYFISIEDGKLRAVVKNDVGGITQYYTVDPVITTGSWQHVGIVYDGAGNAGEKIKFYVNGVAAASTIPFAGQDEGGTPENNAIATRIGAFGDGSNPFAGRMDEIEIFNRALAQSELVAIYDAGAAGKCKACTPPPNNMVSWWSGDGNPNDVFDGNHGTWVGTSAYATGMVAQALNFDGASYITVPDTGNLHLPSNFTLDAWVYPQSLTTPTSFPMVFSKFGGGQSSYELHLQSDGSVRANISGDGTTFDNLVTDPGLVPVQTWTHIATTYESGTWKIFVNGLEVASKISSVTSVFIGTAPLLIGSDTGGNFFNGLIDEAEIFQRALETAEIQAIYAALSSGKCKPPPVVQFRSATYTVGEDNSPAVLTLMREGDSSVTSTVEYVTAGGTATEDTDYEGTTGTVTFNPGEVSKQIFVTIVLYVFFVVL
jgi:hypothetical protein